MAKYIIEMPEGWDIEDPCFCCPIKPCRDITDDLNPNCPLANAKKAVEITTDHMETYEGKDTGEQTINGKPVKLFAVEEEKI